MKLASLRAHLAVWGLRVAWALAVALWALALVPWFRTPPPAPPMQRSAAPLAPAVAARSVEEAGAEPAAQALPAPVAIPALPGAQSERAASAPPAGRDGALCGVTDGASADGVSAAQRAAHVARQASLGLQQAFEALRSRAEIPAQAAGWWLRVLISREGPEAPCAPGTDCAPLPAVPAAVDMLAQLAQSSNDAWVLQIAQRACEGATPPLASCTSLRTRRWSTLEPDNAAAWLELAARDPQAADEALFGAARAARFDAHRGVLAAWVVRATPEQLPALQRYAAWQRSDELERASEARVAATAARACNEAARRDANRDQLCDGAARWLAAAAPSTVEAPAAAANRSLDCASVERLWREARLAAQRGQRVTAQARP